MAKNIKYLPPDDRPYEKLEIIGESNLTNSELLAIIIKNGTKKYNCLEIAQNILNSNHENLDITDLEFVSNLSIEELKSYEGIGKIKAIQIRAVIELSKRISSTYVLEKKKITTPSDIFKLLHKYFDQDDSDMVVVTRPYHEPLFFLKEDTYKLFGGK